MKSTDLYEFTFKIKNNSGFITVVERDLEKATVRSEKVLGPGNWNLDVEKIVPCDVD